jgi:hypothetical protein
MITVSSALDASMRLPLLWCNVIIALGHSCRIRSQVAAQADVHLGLIILLDVGEHQTPTLKLSLPPDIFRSEYIALQLVVRLYCGLPTLASTMANIATIRCTCSIVQPKLLHASWSSM